MKFQKTAGILLTLALLTTGCSAAPDIPPSYRPEDGNQLTVYTSHKASVYLPIIREFEERTGIWVDIVDGGTNEMLDTIRREQDAPKADVMFGGGVESLDAYQDCFVPYTTSEADAIAEAYRNTDACWTPFSALPVVLIYNRKLVDPSELTGWADFLTFQGKAAFADPSISASSFTALVTECTALGDTMEHSLQALTQVLDRDTLESSGEVITAVAEGKSLVGITLEETAMQAVSFGYDIGIVYPKEGTSCIPDGSALIQNAPHPENAKRFLDFTVSYDVQSLLQNQDSRRSVRSDLPAPDALPALETMKLVDYDIHWACSHRDSILAQWKALMEEPS